MWRFAVKGGNYAWTAAGLVGIVSWKPNLQCLHLQYKQYKHQTLSHFLSLCDYQITVVLGTHYLYGSPECKSPISAEEDKCFQNSSTLHW